MAVEHNKNISKYFNPPSLNVTATFSNKTTFVGNGNKSDKNIKEEEEEEVLVKLDRHVKENIRKRKESITNTYDGKLLRRINEGELYKRQKYYPECISLFEKLFKEFPDSPRAVYGQAQCLDYLSEELRSNEFLAKAIEAYGEIENLPDVPVDLLKLAYIRKSDREGFLGRKRDALKTLIRLNKRLPTDIDVLSEVSVAYLNMGADVQAVPFLNKVRYICFGSLFCNRPIAR